MLATSSPALRARIQHVHLLGERNSGTKFIESAFHAVLDPSYGRKEATAAYGSYTKHVPVFGFKHMWRSTRLALNATELAQLARNDNRLFILAVRAPCDWMDGMYRKPWHLCPSEYSRCKNHIYTAIKREYVESKSFGDFMLSP